MTTLSFVLLNLGWGAKSHTLWTGYFIAGTLNNLSGNITSIPIIPDIIMEEDQALAKSITLSLINVASIVNTQLTYIPADYTKTMMWIFAAANTLVMFTVVPNI